MLKKEEDYNIVIARLGIKCVGWMNFGKVCMGNNLDPYITAKNIIIKMGANISKSKYKDGILILYKVTNMGDRIKYYNSIEIKIAFDYFLNQRRQDG